MPRPILAAFFLASLAAGHSSAAEPALTEAPPRSVEAMPPPTETSRITLSVAVNLTSLHEKADAAIPNPIAEFNDSRDGCYKTKIGFVEVSVGCDIWGSVTKRGALSLSGDGAQLSMSLPVHATVSARTHKVQVQETAEADATVIAVATPILGPDWLLSLNLQPDYRWDNPPTVCLFGAICVTVRSLVDPKIRAELDKITTFAEAKAREIPIRAKAQEVWAKLHQPLRISASPEVWLVAEPSAVGFSGVSVAGDTLSATAEILATLTSFGGQRPAAPPLTPLPDLGPVNGQAGTFAVVLPVLVDYTTIEHELGKAIKLGKTSAPVEGQPALTVTPSELKVYPSGDMLAVKVTTALETPIFGGTATFYLAGKPVVDNATRTIRFEGLSLTHESDSFGARMASMLLDPWLNAILAGVASIPYGAEYDRLLAEANAALNRDLGNGLMMNGKLAAVDVDGIVSGETALRIDLRAQGELRLTFGL